MTIEERLDRLEAKLGSHDEMVRELRDAFTVMAHLESEQSKALRDHREWLIGHDRWMLEMRERDKILDERIANLVSGFGEFMRRADEH